LIDERTRKKLVLEHSRRKNEADLDGLLDLYAEEVAFEDPVGSTPRTGRDALRAHFGDAITAKVHEELGEPVAGQDGTHVLVPVTAVMDYLPLGAEFAERGWITAPDEPEKKRLKCEYVLMLRAGRGGRIEELKAFWGRSDIDVID
jgi:steroid Delta-isomerase